MYNNQYMLENLNRQKDKIDEMIRSYQQPQPMNVFNVGNSQIDFEAKIISINEEPKEIMVTRKTAFICFEKPKLTIKEVNGDIKEYDIIIPKTPEQIENDELKEKIKELENKLKEREKNK